MIYTIPTKRGLGIELWGTREDLSQLYYLISNYWNNDQYRSKPDYQNRDLLMSSFSYEIRKARDESRMTREGNHYYPYTDQQYLGTNLSWIHILFSLAALKYNMSFSNTSKLEIATILTLEHWLASSMKEFDEKTAEQLMPYIDGALHEANAYIYNYMRSLNFRYFQLGGGKKAFRQLPDILSTGVYSTDNYNTLKKELESSAKANNCQVSDLEVNDDHFDYDSIQW
ncbi:MAG: hypothetical protein ABJF04_25705 [Reichenbachiella sp.]|uniref:DUF6904 family protein n=1 Tax=Reichenbachiella sp. TaxID=2184521 RepID=UPI003266CAB3